MSFISSLIAKSEDTVLAEFTEFQGNFQQISRYILQKIQPNTTGIIKSGIKKFFFVNENGITIMCLTEDISNEVAFAFLFDVKTALLSKFKFDEVMRVNAYGLKIFESEMSELMEYFQIQPSMTKSGSLVDDFKYQTNCIQENLTKFLNKEVTLTVKTSQEADKFNFGTNLNNLVRKHYYFIIFVYPSVILLFFTIFD